MSLLLNLEGFLSMPIFEASFFDMLIKLAINLLAAFVLIRRIYQPTRKGSEYLFSYMIFSPLIFFICHIFGQTELSIGFAFGLFAVFSILRYRTTTIPVKEMTYMFIVIGIAVINAIGTAISLVELVFINVFIVGLTALLERGFEVAIVTQMVQYERIENLAPDKEESLLNDLETRTGKNIIRFEVVESDFLRDSAKIRIYYKKNEG